MLLNRFNGVENTPFELHKVDEDNLKDFKEFLSICESDGSVNNSSLSKLKFGKWGKEEAWWFIKTDNKIVSMSGSHYLPHISPKCYMLGYRSYTLKEWRGTCSPTKDHRMLNEFHHGAIQPFAVDWAKSRGADVIVTTVNTNKNTEDDPNGLDYKFSRVAKKIFTKHNKYELIYSDYMLYNKYQDIWKLNYRDFRTMEPL